MIDKNNSSEKNISIKITLIGDSSVGKTCIINKYIKNDFNEGDLLSTIGASYSEKIIKKFNKTISLDLWDTAGQERYRAIGRHFYKKSYVTCLIYDITNETSFKNLKDIWYNELKEFGEEVKILAVVGNKNDLFINEKVPEDDARKFADKIGAVFKLTSAKSGDGINELFDILVDKYFEKIMPELVNEYNGKKNNYCKKNVNNDSKTNNNQKKTCC